MPSPWVWRLTRWGAREIGMMSESDQNEDQSKRVDVFALNPRETLPVSESARQLGRPHQVENVLMNQYRCALRQEITSGRETKTRGGSDSVAKGRVVSAWVCGACCLPSSFFRCVRNHVLRNSCLPGFMCDTHMCDTHFGRSSCCARFASCSFFSRS